ncbi:MAG: GNAT family N-acetyltransferase [Janthinobacterium lividum]
METKISCKIAPVHTSHPLLAELIQEAMGNSAPDKIQKVMLEYQALDHFIVGYFEDLNLIGVIGIIKDDHDAQVIIKHIAILSSHKSQGIGKKLVEDVLKRYSLVSLEAITDQNAVNFYQKCGFSCHAFDGKHGTRYRCSLN